MKRILFGLLYCSILPVLSSCSKSPTGPHGYEDPTQLNWTFDTLAYPGSMQTMMNEIWVASASNIYIVGHNDRPGPGTMFQLINGRWQTTNFHATEGGPVAGAVDLSSIRGTSTNNVWAVGERIYDNPNKPPNFLDSSLIIHYNGSSWQEYALDNGRSLHAIWISTPDDIWACGNRGTIFHFNGSVWARDSVPLVPPAAGWEYDLRDITGNNSGDVYLLSQFFDTQGGTMKFNLLRKEYSGPWAVIDSSIISPGLIDTHFGVFSLWTSPSGRMYSVDGNIFAYTGSGWNRMYSGSIQLRKLFGPNDRDIFAVGDFGYVLHYDGSGWTPVNKLKYQNIIWLSGWSDGKEVFILGNTVDGYASTTIIAHGK